MAEIVDAELERDGKILRIKVMVDVITDKVAEGTIVANHRVGKAHGFAPNHPPLDDGEYLITYILHGKRQGPDRVRVQGMKLRGGWTKHAAR